MARRSRHNPFGPPSFGGGPALSLFVGRKKGNSVRVTVEEIAEAAGQLLVAQGLEPGMTVFEGRGVYAPGGGDVPVEEPMVRLDLFLPANTTYAAARDLAREHAYWLAGAFEQSEVLVEVRAADGNRRELLSAKCVGDEVRCTAIRDAYREGVTVRAARAARDA